MRKRLSTRASEKRVIGIVVGVMLAVVAGSVLSYVAQRDWLGATAPREAVTAAPVAPNVTLGDVLAGYTRNQSKLQPLEEIRSARFTGTLTVGGHEYAFELLKKRPDFTRLQVRDERGLLMLGNDGQGSWLAFRDADDFTRLWPLDAGTADWLFLEGPFGTWLSQVDFHDAQLTLGNKQTDAASGKTLWPVTAVSPGGRRLTYWVDDTDFRLQREELHDAGGAQVVDFSNYVTAHGVPLPTKVVAHRPGAPDIILGLQRVEINPGILNATFDPPVADSGSATPLAQGAANAAAPAQNSVLPPPPAGRVAPSSVALGSKLESSLFSNSMMVDGSEAQTNAFTARAAPAIEPAPATADASAPPALGDYGFPWPMPW